MRPRYASSKSENQRHGAPAGAIVAQLFGSDSCTALGLTARSGSPVLALCRKLIEAGVDPATPLQAYRGQTICLKIRSIGEAARLRVGSHGVGFERDPECGAAPPMRFSGRTVVGHRTGSGTAS